MKWIRFKNAGLLVVSRGSEQAPLAAPPPQYPPVDFQGLLRCASRRPSRHLRRPEDIREGRPANPVVVRCSATRPSASEATKRCRGDMRSPPSAFLSLLLVVASVSLLPSLSRAARDCRAEQCVRMYPIVYEYDAEFIRENHDYCKLLLEFNRCLNLTSSLCHGDIAFNAHRTLIWKQMNDFACPKAPPPDALPSSDIYRPSSSGCPFFHDIQHHSMLGYCTLFGDRHLRRFDDSFETCDVDGAFPMADNDFFVVQITQGRRGGLQFGGAITKVSLIIKKANGCSGQKLFEASNEEPGLSMAFTDGTTTATDPYGRPTIQIRRPNSSHVEIELRYITTIITIRRQGPYLGASLRLPLQLVRDHSEVEHQLCFSGCTKRMPIVEALAQPYSFARCRKTNITVPPKLALERCKSAEVTDEFFDACIFDRMVSGNDYLLAMAQDAQRDTERLFHTFRKRFKTGRQNLSLYAAHAGERIQNCDLHEAPSASPEDGELPRRSLLLLVISLLLLYAA
ncbi:hypothetical protein QR680_009296 [Steinernema hermaphroditum]|uniref:Repulsive guidance molecule N-terminal domain-containing protein n=1 Tax=Steinernema hermaphroditum TaxID=289476 RepID=A0AA39IJS7_9BILA|nr:hypothetical protein QR680_009296 [Steinernema hermaphroditum]